MMLATTLWPRVARHRRLTYTAAVRPVRARRRLIPSSPRDSARLALVGTDVNPGGAPVAKPARLGRRCPSMRRRGPGRTSPVATCRSLVFGIGRWFSRRRHCSVRRSRRPGSRRALQRSRLHLLSEVLSHGDPHRSKATTTGARAWRLQHQLDLVRVGPGRRRGARLNERPTHRRIAVPGRRHPPPVLYSRTRPATVPELGCDPCSPVAALLAARSCWMEEGKPPKA